MKWGLILTDAPLLRAVAEDLHQAAFSVTDRVRRKYDGRLDREQEERMTASLRGPDWFGRASSLLAGVGIGIGLGLLFAPSSGHETREMIRDRAVDFKDRIADATRQTLHFSSAGNVTGTNGD
jgi:hypothetical protein